MTPAPTESPARSAIDTLLFSAARLGTFDNERPLTNASGFFFEIDQRLFLVTSRHVFFDAPSKHSPNRIELELHTSAFDLTRSSTFSLLLYQDGKSVWRQGSDSGGEVDVAMVELDRSALPQGTVLCGFTPRHIPAPGATIEVGSSALIVGFPLGFQDTVHRLPVVRQTVIASAYGIRFQGKGFFLTDARTHRGTSGAPVVMRDPTARDPALPWTLLGVHSARMDMANRDLVHDESLGLNSAWYADILITLGKG